MSFDKILKNIVVFGLIVIILFCSYLIYDIRIVNKREQSDEILNFENAFEVKKDKNISESLLHTEGVLYIPSIDVKLPIYTGTEEAALVNGVGIIEGTGDIYSTNKNPVLTAHNGLNGSTLLMNLDKMKINDEFYTKNKEGQIRKYKVIDTKVVEPQEEYKEFAVPGKDESFITLRTCTPTFINSHRLLVTGLEIEFTNEALPKPTKTFSVYEKILIIIDFLSFIALLIVLKREIGGRKNEN